MRIRKGLEPNCFGRKRDGRWLLEHVEDQGKADRDDDGHDNGDDKTAHDGLPFEYRSTPSSPNAPLPVVSSARSDKERGQPRKLRLASSLLVCPACAGRAFRPSVQTMIHPNHENARKPSQADRFRTQATSLTRPWVCRPNACKRCLDRLCKLEPAPG
jgi:hypothetical protein